MERQGAPMLRQAAGWLVTLLHKELLRFWKVSFQTIAAPVLTALLYLLIFSHVLESARDGVRRPGALHGVPGPGTGDDGGAAELRSPTRRRR